MLTYCLGMENPAQAEVTRTEGLSLVGRLMILLVVGTVLAVWLAAVASTIWLAFYAWPSKVGLLLVCIVAFILAVIRPRIPSLPDSALALSREQSPQLFVLSDSLSSALGAPQLQEIRFDSSLRCRTVRSRTGRKIVILGLPLWHVASPSQRAALLAHEVGHLGESSLGGALPVELADSLLDQWSAAWEVGSLADAARGSKGDAVGWFVKYPVHRLFSLLHASHSSRIARDVAQFEQGIDQAVARLVGTAAVREALELSVSGPPIRYGFRAALSRGDDPWLGARSRLASVPAAELAAMRTADLDEGVSAGGHHPPTRLRLEALGMPETQAQIDLLGAATSGMIDDELSSLRQQVQAGVPAAGLPS